MTTDARLQANKAARSASVERLGRAGLASRGVLYLVMSVLTLRLSFEGVPRGDEGPSKTGALRTLAHQSFGRILLVVLAVGFGGYCLWRIAQAFLAHEDTAGATWIKRVGLVARAAVYGVLLVSTAKLLSGSGGGGTDQEHRRVDALLGIPAGRWLVAAVGIGLFVAAGYNAYRAVTKKYEKRWDESRLGTTQLTVIRQVASVGLFGHMFVFAVSGWFLVAAAVRFDRTEPVGLDESLQRLAGRPWGTRLLVAIAVGMAGYACFCFIEARVRRMSAT